MDQHISRVVVPLVRMLGGGAYAPLGTCFPVAPRLFATAAHVVGPNDQGLTVIFDRLDNIGTYQDTTNPNVSGPPVTLHSYDPVRDIAILELPIDASVNFTYRLTGADDVAPGDSITSLGFPHADHGRMVLTLQASTVGAKVLLGMNGVKTKHVVLNTQTRPGQSGGPVMSPDGRQVFAMILGGYSPTQEPGVIIGGIDPQTLHQTTHAVSAEYIRAMI